jgi:hypothetical protein
MLVRVIGILARKEPPHAWRDIYYAMRLASGNSSGSAMYVCARTLYDLYRFIWPV